MVYDTSSSSATVFQKSKSSSSNGGEWGLTKFPYGFCMWHFVSVIDVVLLFGECNILKFQSYRWSNVYDYFTNRT